MPPVYLIRSCLLTSGRCNTDPQDLDNPNATLRTCEQTAMLLRDEDPELLWYNYGIIPDLQVRYYASAGVDVILIDTTLQLFMMRFPCADIHELLTSDLLYQVIKGTFKDHLVQWVEDYL